METQDQTSKGERRDAGVVFTSLFYFVSPCSVSSSYPKSLSQLEFLVIGNDVSEVTYFSVVTPFANKTALSTQALVVAAKIEEIERFAVHVHQFPLASIVSSICSNIQFDSRPSILILNLTNGRRHFPMGADEQPRDYGSPNQELE